jgi:predicted nucleic acid-binding protein
MLPLEVDVDVELRDPGDRIVLAAAVAGAADAVVTGDRGLLDEGVIPWLAGRGIALVTPTELLDELPGQ